MSRRWQACDPRVSTEGPVSQAERPRAGSPGHLVTRGMESRRGCSVKWLGEWALDSDCTWVLTLLPGAS